MFDESLQYSTFLRGVDGILPERGITRQPERVYPQRKLYDQRNKSHDDTDHVDGNEVVIDPCGNIRDGVVDLRD